MDSGSLMVQVIIAVVVILAASWIYSTIKEKAKREVFFKGQYDEQKSFTHRDTIVETGASLEDARTAVVARFPVDMSAKAAFSGGNYKLVGDESNKLTYRRTSSITNLNSGDEFTASVRFAPSEPDGPLRVIVSIEQWREHDGVTRRAGIAAMKEFFDAVVQAIHEIDPGAQVSYSAERQSA